MGSQDGHAAGSLVRTTFDENGVLSLSYANGQTVKGPRLALARFSSSDAVASVGANEFEATIPGAWQTKPAGDGGFGSVRSGMVESSNVDLSQEFNDLIIMQRGYQASSQIISTAQKEWLVGCTENGMSVLGQREAPTERVSEPASERAASSDAGGSPGCDPPPSEERS